MKSCELCGGELFTRPINHPYSATQCKGCGFATTLLETPSSIAGLYPLEQRLRTYARRKREFDRRFTQTLEFLKPSNSGSSFLEIGGNVGAFSLFLASKGYSVQGVEIQPELAEHQRNQGIDCVESLNKLPAGKRYDYIVLMDVLEHIPDCKGFLEGLRFFLRPEGRVFLQFPNHVSVDARNLGERWAWWEAPDHLFHFTPRAVKELAKSVGYKVAEIRTVDLTLDSFLGSLKKPRATAKVLGTLNSLHPINVFKPSEGTQGSLIQAILR
jgi:2-polyprenyl-3-methyl-5-hydroxy-6-metoxy-1,4-benzoquinol methylase